MAVQIIERFIGGEDGKRGFFGGKSSSRSRKVALSVATVAAAVLVMMFSTIGLAVGAVAIGIAWLATYRPGNSGSVAERRARNHEEKKRTKDGFNSFIPVHRRPAELAEPVQGRKARQERYREWNTYRDWPDGLIGLQWLQEGSPYRAAVPAMAGREGSPAQPAVPGIAWQLPQGEQQFLTVVFPLGGQIRGMEPDRTVNQYATRFGDFKASLGPRESRIRRVQMLTRVLPPDSSGHEQWAADHLDRDVEPEAIVSYADVVHQLTRLGYVQRHYVVARWDVSPEFVRAAARRGDGLRGWKALMDSEIESFERRLARAGMDPGNALTARQTAAVFRHLQMPSWPIEQAGDITDPMQVFLAEDSFHDHTTVEDMGPDGQVEKWWHRTARIPIDAVETGPRTPLWLLPLLTGVSTNIIRTVAIESEVIPAQLARKNAKDDLTSDLANLYKVAKEGGLGDEELKVAKRAAESRTKDLEPGTGQHGEQWAMHLTISASSRTALVEAIEVLMEAADASGINELQWLDGWGQAAHAATFPVCRSLKPYKRSKGAVVIDMLNDRGRKDSLR